MSSYDQKLLGDAPKATRAQLQEGYNVNLLEQPAEPPRRTPSMRSPPPLTPTPPPASVPLVQAIAENGSGEKFDSPARPLPPAMPMSKTSFWRTRNGIITMAIVAIVIVGAIVGGAVGGTVGKKSSSSNVASTSHTTTTTSIPQSSSGMNEGAGSQTTQAIAGGTVKPSGFSSSSPSAASPTASGQNNIG